MVRIRKTIQAARALALLFVLFVAALVARSAIGCTTLLVGRQATADGSVLMSSSCDGDLMGLIYVMPERDYPPGTELPMYWNVPRPTTRQEYEDNLRDGYDLVGFLPTTHTCRSILFAGNVENLITGGLNEHGVSIAIEFVPMREGLACDKGVVGPNSNHWTTSLIANALLRAETAREAIRTIGAMVEKYGFLYYRAPSAGVALPIADEDEVWLMEIFGPGEEWTPDSGKPGGVWCAQRIPDGEVGCTANRSRIGRIDLDDTEFFMGSDNVFSLARELDFWEPDEPFVWYEVYGTTGSRANSLREWRALSLAAPSLELKATGDPERDRYPFSVKPDEPVAVPTLIDIMRDAYEDTPFDLTAREAFDVNGKKSPLARPAGSPELFDLLDIEPERTIGTPTSGYVFIAQLREALPDPIGNCLWFTYGPAPTSCFLPIYGGVTDLPDSWDQPANFTRIDRDQAQWNFRLAHNLANRLRYQDAIKDIEQVIKPAEQKFLDLQPEIEKAALRVYRDKGSKDAQRMLTEYARQCTTAVGQAYDELVGCLMLEYLVDYGDVSSPEPPRIAAPVVPGLP